MKGGFVFILLILVFVGVIFLSTSGSLEKIGIDKVDFSIFKNNSSGTSAKSGGTIKKPEPKNSRSIPIKTIASPKSTSTINPKNIPEGFVLEQLSPFFQKIELRSVSPGSASSYGRIRVEAIKLLEGEAVSMRGWQIQGKRAILYIPQAVANYGPAGVDSPSDIVLKNREFINIYSNTSAIGINFRLNKCMGYLENVNKFTPALPRSCPDVLDDFGNYNLSSQCEDYLDSLQTCALSKTNQLWLQNSNEFACRSILDQVNYRGCFERHSTDKNFLSSEWRVWTGSRFLDIRHDRVLLFDNRGLLVDEYEY